jgi:regulator of RNase E activity RraA
MSIQQRLAALSASAIADATGGRGVMRPGLLRYSGSGTVAGQVVTAASGEGSLLAAFPALDASQPGNVLCMTAPGGTSYLGGMLVQDIANRGLAAVVVDGLIRDSESLPEFPVSVFARGTSPIARRGDDPGRSMVAINMGGVTVRPGDWIVADGDGAVVVSPDDVEAVLAKAEEAERLEEQMLERIKAGASVMDAVRAVIGAAS